MRAFLRSLRVVVALSVLSVAPACGTFRVVWASDFPGGGGGGGGW